MSIDLSGKYMYSVLSLEVLYFNFFNYFFRGISKTIFEEYNYGRKLGLIFNLDFKIWFHIVI